MIAAAVQSGGSVSNACACNCGVSSMRTPDNRGASESGAGVIAGCTFSREAAEKKKHV